MNKLVSQFFEKISRIDKLIQTDKEEAISDQYKESEIITLIPWIFKRQ